MSSIGEGKYRLEFRQPGYLSRIFKDGEPLNNVVSVVVRTGANNLTELTLCLHPESVEVITDEATENLTFLAAREAFREATKHLTDEEFEAEVVEVVKTARYQRHFWEGVHRRWAERDSATSDETEWAVPA